VDYANLGVQGQIRESLLKVSLQVNLEEYEYKHTLPECRVLHFGSSQWHLEQANVKSLDVV
jgi:hypothetical protein